MTRVLVVVIAALAAAAVACGDDGSSAANATVQVGSVGGSGSGTVLRADLVVTDAHVVWPAEQISLRQGERIIAGRVVAYDRALDLAFVVPSVALDAAAIASTDPADGAEVTHSGFAQNVEGGGPEEAAGRLTDIAVVPGLGATFLVTNAEAEHGFSGGPLLDADGRVVGITQFRFAGASYALSIADVLRRADELAPEGAPIPAASAVPGLGLADLEMAPLEFELIGERSHAAYLIDSRGLLPGTTGNFSLGGEGDGSVTVAFLDAQGHVQGQGVLPANAVGRIEAPLPAGALSIVMVRLNEDGPVTVDIGAPGPLRALLDEDNELAVTPGDPATGVLDYPSDIDIFTLELPAGGTMLARVSSLAFDPFLQVERIGESGAITLAEDDDSGDGLLGVDAEVQFTASEAGTYRFVISDQGKSLGHAGGYVLTVSEVFEDQ